MCPGMPHAKLQSPSIKIDRYFQLSCGARQKERKKERKKGSERAKAELKIVELCLFTVLEGCCRKYYTTTMLQVA